MNTDRYFKPMSPGGKPSFGIPSPSGASEGRLLCDKLYENLQLLIQYVDLPNLAPFVLKLKLMNAEEYSRLMLLWGNRHLQESIVDLLYTVRHKPDWGRKLILALEHSVTLRHDSGVHLGHVYILKELGECKAQFASGLEKATADLESLLHSVNVYGSMRTNSTLGLLTSYLPLLMQYTDMDILLPFLKVMRLLTDEDYQQLKKQWQISHKRDAVESMLFTLSRKCPEWEDCFVSALHQSLHSEYGDYHDGHQCILETLFNSDESMSSKDQSDFMRKSGMCSNCQCQERVEEETIHLDQKQRSQNLQEGLEFRQSASLAIEQFYKDSEKCLEALNSTHSIHMEWLHCVSSQADALSTLCSEMMDKCQHKRIRQGIQTSLSQLKIGSSAFDTQIDRQTRIYSAKSDTPNEFLKPKWSDCKEMEDMLHNLRDYMAEVLEWTDTAYATLYPHEDLILTPLWRPR